MTSRKHQPSAATALPLALAAAMMMCLGAGCGDSIEPADFASLADYKTWPVVETTGKLPAHGDTVRFIYANPEAASYPGVGIYAPGSVLVKEVRTKNSDGSAGDLDYVAIMRKLDDADAPAGIDLDQGWLFTIVSEVGKTEKTSSCWSSCHVQAPYDGAWLNYGALE